jgi:hypothetical protein
MTNKEVYTKTLDPLDKKWYKCWWLPASGTQRGTIFLRSGDPLTPGSPAIGK